MQSTEAPMLIYAHDHGLQAASDDVKDQQIEFEVHWLDFPRKSAGAYYIFEDITNMVATRDVGS